MQEFAVSNGGIHGVYRIVHPKSQAADRVDHLTDSGLDAAEKRLERLKAGDGKDIAEKSNKGLDS